MSALMYLNYAIAEVGCRNVTVQGMIGRYRLLFDLEFDLKKWERGQVEDYLPYLNSLRAEVRMEGFLIGTAMPTEEDFLHPMNPDVPGTITTSRTFALDLDRLALDEVERRRKSRDTPFELEVLGTATVRRLSDAARPDPQTFGPSVPVEPLLFESRLVRTTVRHQIAQSDWVKLLEQMDYARTLLFEIPWPEDTRDGLAEAVSRFEGARISFLSGYYTEAVGKLRDSMDEARKALDIPGPNWKALADGSQRKEMTREDRFVLAWEAARHLTHSAHHGGSYSREEARYILGMGALTLSLAATAPGVLRKTEGAAP